MIYPWTHSQWQILTQGIVNERLPHALLLSGLEGLGKLNFALEFAKRLLCETPQSEQACHHCRACVQFAAQTHPDFKLIEPEEQGKQIKIDQIRQLIKGFSLSRHRDAHRVAIISPADAMNLSSANSLLKSLEEPPEKTIIILVTAHAASLPATIKSRCQMVCFSIPGKDMALDWLNNNHPEHVADISPLLVMAHGAPLKALEQADSGQSELRNAIFNLFYSIGSGKQSPLSLENQQLKQGIATPIQWLYSWISDLIKMKIRHTQSIVNSDKAQQLQNLAKRVELTGLFQYLDKIVEALRLQRAPLNPQMVMDQLMLEWQYITMNTHH